LAKVGSGSALIWFISALASSIFSMMAGRKCAGVMRTKGGVSNGVANYDKNGFCMGSESLYS
jgi:hypothetical protein